MNLQQQNGNSVGSLEETRICPLRIAYVVHTFGVGGLERCVARLVNGLDRERFLPHVICLARSGAAAAWVQNPDVPIIEMQSNRGNDWRLPRRLAGVLRESQIDIVHSHNWGTLLEATMARRRAKTAVHVHAERGTVLGTVNGRTVRFRLRAMAMRWALNRADAVMSNAAAVARRVEQACGYPAGQIRVIPNGVERQRIADSAAARREIRAKLEIPQAAFVVCGVGRLHPVKGFDLAVRAIETLVRQADDVHLMLVGDGPEERNLRNVVNALQLQRHVHFVGPQREIGRWLAAADLYLNASHSEGMSQSVVEAMSAGLPLVVTDVGDHAVLAGGAAPCGLVVPPNVATAIADAIAMVQRDRDLRQAFGRSALERYSRDYEVGGMIRRYELLYHGLLSGSTASELRRR